ncbi:MAG: hypothetical protein PHT19_02940 [Methylococcus sp.]|nr:hypothetical protein [Methylococcus sp.]
MLAKLIIKLEQWQEGRERRGERKRRERSLRCAKQEITRLARLGLI